MVASVAGLSALFGCSAGADGSGLPASGDGTGAAGASGVATTAGVGGADFGAGGESSVPGCSDGAEHVIVMGFDLSKPVLYRFDPATLAFDELGPLVGCPTGTGFSGTNPWAAALDRDATIWAHYLEWDSNAQQFTYARVHTIDTATGACADAGPGLINGLGKPVEYGLAFVRDPGDPAKDILYAAANGANLQNNELDTVDTATMAMTTVGPLNDTAHSFLTGAGDGRLFSLYRIGEMGLREIDPATASTVSDQPITGLNSSQGPFVFWGGAIWAFWMKTYEAWQLETDVYRIDMTTWTAVKVATVDFIVTAATVSTCAPIAPPE